MATVGLECVRACAGGGLRWLWGRSRPITVTVAIVLGLGAVHLRRYLSKEQGGMGEGGKGRGGFALPTPGSPYSSRLSLRLEAGDLPTPRTHSLQGEKPFLMGEVPCEVDCSIFSFLSQIMWCYDGSPYVAMLNGFPNLPTYVLRMKERLWPDWDQFLVKPKKG